MIVKYSSRMVRIKAMAKPMQQQCHGKANAAIQQG